ncbi:MAG: trypsin-like peptidase domain-containing protein [Solirubrobacterales bacterium]|nr:trypsin-like peptidase domain-containing protein [Solirubrobacterales bacterium]
MTSVKRILPVIAGAVAGGLIALVVANASSSTHSVTTTVVQPAHASPLPTSTGGRGLSVNQIYNQASPGVVDIVVTSQSGGINPFSGSSQESQGEGAGVVYDSKGDILTDEHVVNGATNVQVKFRDGKTAKAKVLGTDPSTDVAVIHVDVPSSELHPVPLTDSSAAQVGDATVAVGSPFSLPETTTTGIVSAVGRSITAPNHFTIPGAIQTDAAINPGNSGGPLLDGNGKVLGLVDQINTNSGGNEGVGFAIPSNTAARVANAIISGQSVRHAYVGVSLDPNSSGGARVSTQPDQQGNPPVRSGSPADKSGVQPGDLVTAINGKSINSTDDFIATVDGYAPGDTITFTIKRGGQTHDIKLTLAARPTSATQGG